MHTRLGGLDSVFFFRIFNKGEPTLFRYLPYVSKISRSIAREQLTKGFFLIYTERAMLEGSLHLKIIVVIMTILVLYFYLRDTLFFDNRLFMVSGKLNVFSIIVFTVDFLSFKRRDVARSI